ncbi:MAG: hypothetical protein DRQ04_03115 [Candidatus Hydrothermota bacterium]|nr:MAG: hypothetical protein DRQ04_03115 [Candidatus Hydrothermae bacterium]
MKFLRALLILSGLILVISGCGVKNPEVQPAPDVSRLLNTAWTLYDNGNYSAARDTFEFVTTLDVFNYEAYVGYGLSSSMLGEFDNAHTAFTFAVSIIGANEIKLGIEIIPDDSANFSNGVIDTVDYTNTGIWKLKLSDRPVLGIENISISGNSPDLRAFNDSVLTLVNYAPVDPEKAETVKVYYYYYDTTVPPDTFTTWALSGNAASFVAQGSGLMHGIVQAGGALKSWALHGGSIPVFTHKPNFSDKQVGLTLALATFKEGLYANTVDAIKTWVDPDWDFSGDPFDPDNLPVILAKLEEEIKNN